MILKVVPKTILNVSSADLTVFIRHAYRWEIKYGDVWLIDRG